jgi:hypothetical protein
MKKLINKLDLKKFIRIIKNDKFEYVGGFNDFHDKIEVRDIRLLKFN